MRRAFAVLAACFALALGISACGDSGPDSPSGGYDAQGYPLDESGNVSSDPEDYRELVCDKVGEMATDYEEECQ